MLKFKTILMIALVAPVVIAKPATALTGHSPDPLSVDRGQALYTKNCISCHAQDGVGEVIPWGIRNPEYLAAMPLNETSHAWHHGDEQLIQMIQRGNQRMPQFGQILSPSELADIVAYIKSLWSDRILDCQGPKHMSCM